ncbi:GntR family transcriptional regulator [Gordonia sp. zg691]|uniref:GntR family transcriptional regulator n=1 Tax=Gordonia jinghuaiqii TaxID=2758710 RepID=A0A7D7LVC7_9ACTN|nr:GntR family transcriptional regulator [Gordonia jinghuaiqii]MBD0860982.1 GntR family transcriptional regulator [Gordonia jinghuaiqii]MCR5979459.1 FCD domain-containing protein [Gordonia jinghuaiqii]MCR5979881.1 FCD domain-containing protein [Gordonia jinghuaiqii]QMT00738.1 GntR family transcriptional regulator [Gordonia jinghuaiqii]
MTDRLLDQLGETRSGNARANVLEELRRLILSGGAPPGAQIPPAEIADAFGVSPIPVREALKTLVGEGLVVHRPGVGYRVSQPSTDELREIYFVRGTLEQAALARAVDLIDDASLQTARDRHADLLVAVKYKDGKAFHDTSREFHRALTSPCAMPRLLNMFEATWNLTEPFQMMRSVTPETQQALNDDHAALLEAFADRDAASVLDVAHRHHRRLESAIIETADLLDVRHD